MLSVHLVSVCWEEEGREKKLFTLRRRMINAEEEEEEEETRLVPANARKSRDVCPQTSRYSSSSL